MMLKSIYLDSFRGATKPVTIDFDSSKKITLIFAENGNGKSTIADALVCLLTNEKGSIDDKSGVDTQFIKSLDANTAKISMTTDTNTYSATITGNAKDFTKHFPDSAPDIRYLRRTQIISLLNLKPSDRYEQLKNYIDVSGVYKSEEELRKLSRDIDEDTNTLVSVIENSKATLDTIWTKEGSPMNEMLVWAKSESEKDITQVKIDLDILKGLSQQWREIGKKYNDILLSITSVNIARTNYKSAFGLLQKLQEQNTVNNADLLNLLEQAKKYIGKQSEIKNCPICSSNIEQNDIILSLDRQITSMSALGKAAKSVEVAKKDFDRKAAVINQQTDVFSNMLIKHKDSISKYQKSIPAIIPFVESISIDKKANYLCYQNNLEQLSILATRISSSEENKSKTIIQHNSISEQFKSISLNSKKFDYLIKLSKAAEKTLSIVENTRKEYYDNELLSISGEVERMYQHLHKDEGLGGIKLFLNPKFKTSLELQANFYNQEGITPQSVYSESHLDTLGICIFLALAKKYSDGNSILVLDDVVMSVDENHLNKFIDLLHEEADNFGQIIITTHYRPWKDRYRTHRAPGGKVHFLELRKWSKENGIRVQNGRVELQELEIALNDNEYFDRQIIASKSGIILENILDYLTDIYEYYVPKRKDSKYTLGELIDTLQPKYLKNIKVVQVTKSTDASGNALDSEAEYQIQPIIDDLKSLLFIRNQVGAHFNLIQDANDEDVELFGKKTLELGKLLVCNETGQLPLYKSVDHWRSKNGSIKLYPSEKI